MELGSFSPPKDRLLFNFNLPPVLLSSTLSTPAPSLNPPRPLLINSEEGVGVDDNPRNISSLNIRNNPFGKTSRGSITNVPVISLPNPPPPVSLVDDGGCLVEVNVGGWNTDDECDEVLLLG